MSRIVWECPEPGCDYRAGMLPTTDQGMVLNLHYARAHPGLLTIEGAGHPEFSEGAYEVTDTADPFSLHANARAYDFPPEDEVDGSGYTSDPDWQERMERNGVIIWDDPPPTGPLSEESAKLYRDYYADRPDPFAESEVRCGTWLVPAAFALAAVGVVYLSYRWTGR